MEPPTPGTKGFGLGQAPNGYLHLQVANCDGTSCVSTSSSDKNPHINYGAVVEGPTLMDNYSDNRTSSSMAGVHLDTNAGLSGMCFMHCLNPKRGTASANVHH
jgi:hypothetical protein